MRDHERDLLFARARDEATPSDHDRRRVRAALARRLSTGAGAATAATVATSAAANVPSAVPAITTLTTGLLAKGAALLVAAVVVGVVAARPEPVKRGAERVLPSQSVAVSSASPEAPPKAVVAPSPPPRLAPAPTRVVAVAAPAERDPSPGTRLSAPSARRVTPPEDAPLAIHSEVPPSKPSTAQAEPPVVDAVTPGIRPPPEAPPPAVPTTSAAPASPFDPADVTLVQEMQLALRGHDASHALALVREHERRFPSSVLAPERDGVKVLALCMGVSPDVAERLGGEFLSRHPTSPLVARVRGACSVR